MADVRLYVNGLEFSGWKRARIVRSIESIAGGFDLEVSERWSGQTTPWPITEEDVCSLRVNGQTLITGYVDKRKLSLGSSEHSLSVSGRDKTGALVDCSAVLDTWEFSNTPLVTLVQNVCAKFAIPVTVDPTVSDKSVSLSTGKSGGSVSGAGKTGRLGGLKLPKPPKKFSIDPGESAFEVIDRVCRMSGVLPVSDGVGGLVLTRAGTSRVAVKLVEGDNILSGSADYDKSACYRVYRVLTQHPGSSDWFGEGVSAIKGESLDESVLRSERILLIHAEQSMTPQQAQTRAAWEAKVRAARGDSVSLTVQGWTMPNGQLWPVNQIASVKSPLLGINGDLLITQTEFSLDGSGSITRLSLKRPDAFLPEPVITAKSALWKELA